MSTAKEPIKFGRTTPAQMFHTDASKGKLRLAGHFAGTLNSNAYVKLRPSRRARLAEAAAYLALALAIVGFWL